MYLTLFWSITSMLLIMSRFFTSLVKIFINKRIYYPILLLNFIWVNVYTNSYAQWQPAISNTTQTLYKANYDGGVWVAVGDNGTVVTSVDGITWAPQISTTTATLRDVYYSNGLWVAVGGNGTDDTIITSPDGINWTPRITPRISSFNLTLSGISYTGGKWIASTTYSDQVLTSTDGINWTVQSLSFIYNNQSFSLRYVSLKCGNGKWVATIGTDVYTSSDNGITWELTFSRSRGIIYYISYSNGKFAASGFYGTILTSSDGAKWTYGTITEFGGVDNICYGNGKWLTCTSAQVLNSSNGANWHSWSKPGLLSAAYNGTQWLLVGGNGTILYNSDAALPVSLIRFQGDSQSSIARLTWETAWEKEASHFLVERSQDAKSFEAVERINAHGTTTLNQQYTFLDEGLSVGLWYYRLRQVDLDGTFTYSQIIGVRVGTEPLDELTLSPNPSPGLLLVENKTGINSVHIYSATGEMVHQQLFEQVVDRWTWEGNSQSAGIYLVRIQAKDGKVTTLRWVKQ